jgi:DinB superfamily
MTGRTEVDVALARFSTLDAQELSQPWRFHDKPSDVRYALYRTLEDAQEVLVRLATLAHPESRRILALAQRAFGDLRGLLVGLPVDFLDRSPRQGEWSIRETLRHIMVIEGRYAVQTRYATERADSDPMRVADDQMPTPAQIDVSGDIEAILARMRERRGETDRRLGNLSPAAMIRPTQWMQYDVDVRFRLHRFAAHVIEHTIQCEKTLNALGGPMTEGRRIVRRLTGTLGEVEGHGGHAEAREIEQRLAERAASVAAA